MQAKHSRRFELQRGKAPGVAEIQLNLADILAANGRKEEAREVLTDLLNDAQSEETKQAVRDVLDNL